MARQKCIYDTRQLPVVLTVEKAAQFLDINEKTLRKLLKAGDIKGKKVGEQWRILKADVLAFIGAEEVPA